MQVIPVMQPGAGSHLRAKGTAKDPLTVRVSGCNRKVVLQAPDSVTAEEWIKYRAGLQAGSKYG